MANTKWQISDEFREITAPFIPEHKTPPPLGTHRRRVNRCSTMNATSVGASSSTDGRFQEWHDASVFERF